MRSLNKELLNTDFVPGTVLATGDKAMDKTDQTSPSDGIYILAENTSQLSSSQLFTITGKPLVSMPPRGYLAKFGNIYGCHSEGVGTARLASDR